MITLTIIMMILSALFSGTEIAFVTGDRVRMQIDVQRGGLINRIISRFYSNAEFFISSLLVGNNVVLVIYGMGTAAILTPWLEDITDSEFVRLLLQTIISTLVILLTGEFLPKSIFKINPNASLRVFALPVFLFYLLLYPISWFTTWLSRCIMKLVGAKSEKPHLHALSVGDLNDYLEETIDTMAEKKEEVDNEVKLFQNALDFSTTHLRDCMIPRNEIVAVNIETTTRRQLSDLFTKSGRSKIIVYRDDIDNILGYIHVSELFLPQNDWKTRIIPVLYAPETMLANKMMRRLLAEKRSISIVIDEFGGTAGLVTLEDLVEEIFGDIRDEHDKPEVTARMVAPGLYEFAGRCEIAYINDTFHLDLPEEDDYQTIAGYILHSTGVMPEQGETITLGNLKIEITKKSANRIEMVSVSVPDVSTESDTATR